MTEEKERKIELVRMELDQRPCQLNDELQIKLTYLVGRYADEGAVPIYLLDYILTNKKEVELI